jgi:putative FmdB family regulatory protein
MPYYNYKCDACEKPYKELRASDHEQSRLICDLCGGNFIEQSE